MNATEQLISDMEQELDQEWRARQRLAIKELIRERRAAQAVLNSIKAKIKEVASAGPDPLD